MSEREHDTRPDTTTPAGHRPPMALLLAVALVAGVWLIAATDPAWLQPLVEWLASL